MRKEMNTLLVIPLAENILVIILNAATVKKALVSI